MGAAPGDPGDLRGWMSHNFAVCPQEAVWGVHLGRLTLAIQSHLLTSHFCYFAEIPPIETEMLLTK